jgi:hypothetical protein
VLGFEAPLTIETDVALIPELAAGDMEELELDIEELEPDIAGFWPNCNVSVVTIAGTILIRRSALLVPKEADNPSPKTGFVQSDNRIEEKIVELISRQIKKKEPFDEPIN